jgi:ribosomal protein S11
MWGKWSRRVNIVQKMCIHVYKCKNDTVETTPGISGGEIMENSRGTLDTL